MEYHIQCGIFQNIYLTQHLIFVSYDSSLLVYPQRSPTIVEEEDEEEHSYPEVRDILADFEGRARNHRGGGSQAQHIYSNLAPPVVIDPGEVYSAVTFPDAVQQRPWYGGVIPPVVVGQEEESGGEDQAGSTHKRGAYDDKTLHSLYKHNPASEGGAQSSK